MTYSELLVIVKNKFKDYPKRLKHTLGVVEIAEKLALAYNLNVEDIKIATLFHDFTKHDSLDYHKSIINKDDFIKYKNHPFMYHAISASILIKDKYNIKDHNIISSIRNHVIGNSNLSLFDKVVLISDKIELGRTYPGVEYLRELAFEDIDLAIITYLEQNIKHHKKEGLQILDEQYETLNKMKEEYNGKIKNNL